MQDEFCMNCKRRCGEHPKREGGIYEIENDRAEPRDVQNPSGLVAPHTFMLGRWRCVM